ERTRNQHTALLAARELEKRAVGEVEEVRLVEQRAGALEVFRRGREPRHVRPETPRQHDVDGREVPAEARVAVLQLVTDERDVAARLDGVALGAVTEVVRAPAASRCRPARACNE